jgi:hypothetical protein
VPDDVSIIARDQDSLFSGVLPPISHYSIMRGEYDRRLSRLMVQMVGQGYLIPEPNLIFPRFVVGGTVVRREEDRRPTGS